MLEGWQSSLKLATCIPINKYNSTFWHGSILVRFSTHIYGMRISITSSFTVWFLLNLALRKKSRSVSIASGLLCNPAADLLRTIGSLLWPWVLAQLGRKLFTQWRELIWAQLFFGQTLQNKPCHACSVQTRLSSGLLPTCVFLSYKVNNQELEITLVSTTSNCSPPHYRMLCSLSLFSRCVWQR